MTPFWSHAYNDCYDSIAQILDMALSFFSILLFYRSGLVLVSSLVSLTLLSQYVSHVGQLVLINIKLLNTVTTICYLADFCFVLAVCRDLNKLCAENTLLNFTCWAGRSVRSCGITEQRRQQKYSSNMQQCLLCMSWEKVSWKNLNTIWLTCMYYVKKLLKHLIHSMVISHLSNFSSVQTFTNQANKKSMISL